MLEEVGIPRETLLDFVPRARAHHCVVGDDTGAIESDTNDPETVIELERRRRERKDVVRFLDARRPGHGRHDHDRHNPHSGMGHCGSPWCSMARWAKRAPPS